VSTKKAKAKSYSLSTQQVMSTFASFVVEGKGSEIVRLFGRQTSEFRASGSFLRALASLSKGRRAYRPVMIEAVGNPPDVVPVSPFLLFLPNEGTPTAEGDRSLRSWSMKRSDLIVGMRPFVDSLDSILSLCAPRSVCCSSERDKVCGWTPWEVPNTNAPFIQGRKYCWVTGKVTGVQFRNISPNAVDFDWHVVTTTGGKSPSKSAHMQPGVYTAPADLKVQVLCWDCDFSINITAWAIHK